MLGKQAKGPGIAKLELEALEALENMCEKGVA